MPDWLIRIAIKNVDAERAFRVTVLRILADVIVTAVNMPAPRSQVRNRVGTNFNFVAGTNGIGNDKISIVTVIEE